MKAMIELNEFSPEEVAVLAALLDEELDLLEIPKIIEESSDGKIKIGFGYIYPIIHELKVRGLTKIRWGKEIVPTIGGWGREICTVVLPIVG